VLMFVVVVLFLAWLAGWRRSRIPVAVVLALMLLSGQAHRGPAGDLAVLVDAAACFVMAWLLSGLPFYFRSFRARRSMPTRLRLGG